MRHACVTGGVVGMAIVAAALGATYCAMTLWWSSEKARRELMSRIAHNAPGGRTTDDDGGVW